MAKELPYFKFYVNDWLNGDITLEVFELQGLFINVCAYYWSKDCDLTYVNLLKKFRDNNDQIQMLIDCKVIKIEKNHVSISFLNEQVQSKEVQKINNRKNGLLGGRPKKEITENKPNGLIFDNLNESESITKTKANDNPNITNINKSKVKNIDSSIVMSAKADQTNKFLDRLNKFTKSIEPYLDIYGKEMCNNFFFYWTEKNKSNTKMKFELEKTWDVKLRLKRWADNNFTKDKKDDIGYSPQLTN